MGFGGRGLLVLLRAEDEFRRGEHHGDHRPGAGFPGATGLLGLEENLRIAGELEDRGRAAEGAADEPVRDELRAGVAGRGTDRGDEAALKFGTGVGRTEQAETETRKRAGVARDFRGRIEPLERELVLAGLQRHLGLGDFGFLDRLKLILPDLDAIDDEGDLRRRIAGRAGGAETDRDG